MEKKQNSIEWLIEQFDKYYATHHLLDEIEQAKEMHKQEIIDAWDNAAIEATYGNKYKNFEQYYNETYGGNK